jgi:predicted nucleotidyltransferase
MAPMQLPEDFKEFFRFLNETGVEYLLIGGWAVGFHGCPRATADMDVWVACDPANARRVVLALQLFGFTHGEATESLFTQPGFVVRIGLPPMRIELLTKISGVEFSECRARCETMIVDEIAVSVIALEDLIANKKASARPKDLADVDALES